MSHWLCAKHQITLIITKKTPTSILLCFGWCLFLCSLIAHKENVGFAKLIICQINKVFIKIHTFWVDSHARNDDCVS